MARHWLNTLMLAAAVSAGLPCTLLAQDLPAAVTEVSPALPLPEAIRQDIQQLIQTLNDPAASQPQREEAARRLASRGTPEAMAQLRSILTDTNNLRGQAAVALALADRPGDETFVAPLATLLVPDARLTAAAATALAAYKDNPEALAALTTFARTAPPGPERKQREAARIGVIGALGTLADKRAAATLVELLRSDLEPDAITTAAAEALAVLAGERDWGRDPQRWTEWWNANGDLSEAEFRSRILSRRAGQADVFARREEGASARLRAVLNEQYLAAPREQKPVALTRYLTDDSAVVRALGAALVYEEARNANPPTAAMRERLRAMVGDSDPHVRVAVATTLRQVNDPGSIDPVRVQLAQETNTAALIAQVGVLGAIGDPRAIGSLTPLLDHPSDVVALVAVRSLGQLGGPLRQADAKGAGQLRDRLIALLNGRAARAGAEPLRAATVTALGSVADATLTGKFVELLRPREAPIVRVAALNAIAAARDTKAVDALPELFNPANTEREVRLAAVNAMGAVGSFEYASLLLRRMNKADEPDEEVRNAATLSLNRLLPSGDKRGLKQLADQFRQDPPRRLSVLKVLVTKLQQQNDPDLVLELQNLGQVQAQNGLYRDAAASFKPALDQLIAQGQGNAVLETLTEQYLQALLRSVQYPEAAKFAEAMIARDNGNAETVFRGVRSEAEQLRKEGNLAGALRLVATFRPLRMGRYNTTLAEMESDIQQELNQKTNVRPTGNATGPDHHEYLALVMQNVA
jgi:HEAT repeat protein